MGPRFTGFAGTGGGAAEQLGVTVAVPAREQRGPAQNQDQDRMLAMILADQEQGASHLETEL